MPIVVTGEASEEEMVLRALSAGLALFWDGKEWNVSTWLGWLPLEIWMINPNEWTDG